MKIGDFAKLAQVSVRMLRYYDKVGLLKPEQVDPYTRHRSYSINQVPTLRKIVLLRDLDFSVAEIKEIIQHWDKATLVDNMKARLADTYNVIEEEQKRAQKLQEAIAITEEDDIETHYNVIFKPVSQLPVVSLRKKITNYSEEGRLWDELDSYVQAKHLPIDKTRYNQLAIYHCDNYQEGKIDIEVCYIVKSSAKLVQDSHFRLLEEVPIMASMLVYGPYQNIKKAQVLFINWLSKRTEYTLGNTSRQITIIDDRHTDNPEKYLTELQLPLSTAENK